MTLGPKRAPQTLDLAAAYDALPADAQRRLGIAAIAVGAAGLANYLDPDETPAEVAQRMRDQATFFEVAGSEGVSVMAGVIEVSLMDGHLERLQPPSLSALGIRQCTGCGCTDTHACDGGCSWIGATLCSHCGPRRG